MSLAWSNARLEKFRRYTPLWIFLTAFLVRLAYLSECTAKPYFGSLILDSRYIVAQADYVLKNGQFPQEPFFRPPLYTLLVAGFRSLFGQDTAFWIALFQHLLGAGFCVLCWWGCVLCKRPIAGAFAGLSAALYAPLVFYEGEMLSDAPALFLYMAFLVTWLRATTRRKFLLFAVSGILAGLAAITRPNVVLVAIVFPLLYIASAFARKKTYRVASGTEDVLSRPEPGPKTGYRIAAAVLFLLLFGMIVAIPSVRNARMGDYNFIASQGGINFYVGNSRMANGTNVIIPRQLEPEGEYKDAVEEYGKLGYLIDRHGFEKGFQLFRASQAIPLPSQLSQFWYRRGIDDLFENWRRAAAIYTRKFVALINNYEVRNNKDFFFVRQNLSTVLTLIPFTFGWIFPLAMLGAWHVVWSRDRCGIWIVWYTLIIGGSVMMYFVAGRLRLPLLAGVFVLAGFGMEMLHWFYQSMVELVCLRKHAVGAPYENTLVSIVAKDKTRAIVFIIFVLLLTFVSFYHFPQLDYRTPVQQESVNRGIYSTSYFPEEWAVTALASMEAGRADAAEKYARTAVEKAPDFSYGHLVLGNALYAQRKLHEAAWAYRKAHEAEPQSARPLANLAAVAIDLGETTIGVILLNAALARSPGNVAALTNLAALHLRAGQEREAQTLAESVLQNAPDHPTAIAVKAIIENRAEISNSVTPAIEELRRLVKTARVDPAVFATKKDLENEIRRIAPGDIPPQATNSRSSPP